ncbi:MAG: ABC transporter ATP-binding protein [bacterium]|jgi:ATP-binding cassette subfamily B multidrug efflux pump
MSVPNDNNQHRPPQKPGPGWGARHRMMFGPQGKAKDIKGTGRRLWAYLRQQQKALVMVFALVIVASAANLTGPFLIGRAIDNHIKIRDFAGLGRISLVMVAVYALASLTTWLQQYLIASVAQDTVLRLRTDLFSKIQTLPLRFFDRQAHGELMSRITNDIENVNLALSTGLTQLFSGTITVIGTFLAMLWLSPLLTVITLLVVPLIMITIRQIAQRTRRFFLSHQKKLGQLNGIVEETLTGQRTVKVFGREENVLEEFAAVSSELRQAGIQAQIFSGIIPPLMHMFGSLSFGIVAGAGGLLAARGIITVGVIASFIQYSRQFTRPLSELANLFNTVQSALAGAERVFEIMDEQPEEDAQPGMLQLKDIQGKVQFDHVTFGYQPGIWVLKDINLTAHPGQLIALVGPTGAGKTTFVNLLARFYELDQGKIYIDGQDISMVGKESIRSALGIVLQDTYLFSETVRDNIRYGKLQATDAEVEYAARLAHAEPFILRLPEQYDTVLSQDGDNLSQGERQLLSIARAILADPAILILDEATSNVDTRTELQIQKAMVNLMQDRTTFVIAHRLSTIQNADLILVIDDGKIIERGTHKELLRAKGFYFNLYQNQFQSQAS